MFHKKQHNDVIEALFLEQGPCLERFIYSLVRNKHDAEDLLADTIVRTIEYVVAYGVIPEKAYLYTMAKHLAIDFLRRQKKVTLSFDQSVFQDTVSEDLVEETILEAMDHAHVKDLIDGLPYPYGVVFGLRFYEGMSFKDMAGILAFSENNLRQIYYRAKIKLKEIIEKEQSL